MSHIVSVNLRSLPGSVWKVDAYSRDALRPGRWRSDNIFGHNSSRAAQHLGKLL
jgi:hypothetical protein